MVFKKLYKKSKKGKIMTWCIDIKDNKLFIEYGYIDGKIRQQTRDVKTNKSGRSLEEQLKLEAESKYNKKLDEGYTTDIDNCDSNVIPEPMLAYELKESVEFPLFVQVKLDGIRALYKNGVLYSRKKKSLIYTNQHFMNIRNELQILCKNLPDNIILDGELYIHNTPFNKITSIVRTQKTIHRDEHLLKYYIFDMIDYDKEFTERFSILSNAFKKSTGLEYLKLVEYNVANDHDDIKKYFDEYRDNNYEGLIARIPSGKYISGRTYNLMKYKLFCEDEGEIIDIHEGEGTEKGLAVFTIKDKNGKIFNARPQGTFEVRKQWFNNSSSIIGKIVTYKYFELSDDGIPRFPVVKEIRDYEN